MRNLVAIITKQSVFSEQQLSKSKFIWPTGLLCRIQNYGDSRLFYVADVIESYIALATGFSGNVAVCYSWELSVIRG